jgi:hypothetical protein
MDESEKAIRKVFAERDAKEKLDYAILGYGMLAFILGVLLTAATFAFNKTQYCGW